MLISLLEETGCTMGILMITTFEAILIFGIYGINEFCTDLIFMSDHPPPIILKILFVGGPVFTMVRPFLSFFVEEWFTYEYTFSYDSAFIILFFIFLLAILNFRIFFSYLCCSKNIMILSNFYWQDLTFQNIVYPTTAQEIAWLIASLTLFILIISAAYTMIKFTINKVNKR